MEGRCFYCLFQCDKIPLIFFPITGRKLVVSSLHWHQRQYFLCTDLELPSFLIYRHLLLKMSSWGCSYSPLHHTSSWGSVRHKVFTAIRPKTWSKTVPVPIPTHLYIHWLRMFCQEEFAYLRKTCILTPLWKPVLMLSEEAGAVSNFHSDKKPKIESSTTQSPPKGAAGGCWWGKEGERGSLFSFNKGGLELPRKSWLRCFHGPSLHYSQETLWCQSHSLVTSVTHKCEDSYFSTWGSIKPFKNECWWKLRTWVLLTMGVH